MKRIYKWLFDYSRGVRHLDRSDRGVFQGTKAGHKAYIQRRRFNMRRDLYLRVRYYRRISK